MNFGSANRTGLDQKASNHNSPTSESISAGSSFQRILQKGRLTDEDLRHFQLNILKAHKKKHYRVLIISAILFIFLGMLLYYLAL